MNPTFDLFRSTMSSVQRVPFHYERQSLSRRGMLRRSGAVAIGVGAAVSLPIGSNRAEAAVGFLLKAAFSAAVGWVVEKALDHIFESYATSEPRVVENRVRPTSGRNVFHDAHASQLSIAAFRSDTMSCYSNRLSGRVDRTVYVAPSALCSRQYGVWCHDLNEREMILLHTIYEQKCVTSIPFPSSARQQPTDDDASYISSLLRKERVDPTGISLEYTRKFQNLSGDQITGFALSPNGDPEKRSLVFV